MSYMVQEYHVHFTEEALRQVAQRIEGISDEDLHFRLHATSNSIGWDAWHIFRTVDNLVHFAFDREQPVWLQQGLDKKWDLPRVDQGTAMSPEEAWAMRFPPADQLAQYGQDVVDAVLPRMSAMSDDYLQVVTRVAPWGDRTRLWILGKVITHSSKHLGYLAAALGPRGRQGPSFWRSVDPHVASLRVRAGSSLRRRGRRAATPQRVCVSDLRSRVDRRSHVTVMGDRRPRRPGSDGSVGSRRASFTGAL